MIRNELKRSLFKQENDNFSIHSLHLRHWRSHLKDELRGVWVTTVRNMDFPDPIVFAEGNLNAEAFKREYLDVLKRSKELKLNAIFFQVRPQGDAFYDSKLNPWSQYLTGRQGRAPLDGFDPLAWMVEAAHMDGMEFHAWLNPYRLTPSTVHCESIESCMALLSANHPLRQHPEWAYFFNGGLYLNPGVPEVTQFLVATVREILEKYDVDAIHLDDYFYPYSYETEVDGQIKSVNFADVAPDLATFEAHKQDGQSIDQWREANINALIKRIHGAIAEYNQRNKRSVAFGVSPFGVWASAEETEGIGSLTSPYQLSSLSEFVNSKLWIDEGWLDYIVPQNYWGQNHPLSPFKNVATWWDQIVDGKKTHLYMGLGPYLYEEDAENPDWQRPEEIVDQIHFLRTLPRHDGYVFFSYANLDEDRTENGVLLKALQKLKTEVQPYFALVPPRDHLQEGATPPVANLSVSSEEGCHVLHFEDAANPLTRFYVIYRHEGASGELDIENAANILDIVGKNQRTAYQTYTDAGADCHAPYTYGVTALSQAQVESSPVFIHT